MQTIITAAEARAQGSTPAALLSVARFNQRIADKTSSASHAAWAQQLRRVAIELGDLLGVDIRRRPRRAANDNRRQGKPQQRRRAA
jgi:hypothetical protein